jgi:hypothetical protein
VVCSGDLGLQGSDGIAVFLGGCAKLSSELFVLGAESSVLFIILGTKTIECFLVSGRLRLEFFGVLVVERGDFLCASLAYKARNQQLRRTWALETRVSDAVSSCSVSFVNSSPLDYAIVSTCV